MLPISGSWLISSFEYFEFTVCCALDILRFGIVWWGGVTEDMNSFGLSQDELVYKKLRGESQDGDLLYGST